MSTTLIVITLNEQTVINLSLIVDLIYNTVSS